MLIATGAIMALSLIFTITLPLHMLQLNSYYNVRLLDYLKGEFKPKTVIAAADAIVVAATAFFSPAASLVSAVLSAGIRIIYSVYKTRHAKKKIVFTSRVKRMYATWIVLLLAVGVMLLFDTTRTAAICVYGLFWAVTPFCAMAVNLINAPFESSVRRWFVKDAKKKLAMYDKITVIGLTGSYGKTSTKHILARILSEKYNVCMTPGGLNTPMGVVRTIRENLQPGDEIFIAEMGAKRVGDVKEICDIVHPTVGIITSVGLQHLNTFGSVENIAKTKFELCDDVLMRGGRCYLNFDSEMIVKTASERGLDQPTYAIENKSAALRAENIRCSRRGLSFDIVGKARKFTVTTGLLGRHSVLNILAAVSVAIDFDLSDNDIIYAVGRLEPVEHRLQMKPFYNGAVLIDDAYNANPEGSVEAMRVLGSFAPMKRVAVTPGLVELGEREYECNEALGFECAENADEIFLVGIERSKPLMAGILRHGFDEDKVHVVKTFTDAAMMLKSVCDKNTAVIFENDLPDNYAK